jgi:hypothetical protein
MRLLQIQEIDWDYYVYDLVEYYTNIPPYAILSHTWGADNEEVTLQDILNGTTEKRAAYEKLRIFARNATLDGLSYIWIDTCCIDKSSSAELSEAINSMFKWYQRARVCYVYLADVKGDESDTNPSSIRDSRWFTRGWTLQELLAPTSVRFLNAEGDDLGDKISLQQDIMEATGIPARALEGHQLKTFTVDERLSWAKNRQTKREEDAAYSLMGLLDINMPLLYGEGRERAILRLRRELRHAQYYQKTPKEDMLTTFFRDHWPHQVRTNTPISQ